MLSKRQLSSVLPWAASEPKGGLICLDFLSLLFPKMEEKETRPLPLPQGRLRKLQELSPFLKFSFQSSPTLESSCSAGAGSGKRRGAGPGWPGCPSCPAQQGLRGRGTPSSPAALTTRWKSCSGCWGLRAHGGRGSTWNRRTYLPEPLMLGGLGCPGDQPGQIDGEVDSTSAPPRPETPERGSREPPDS